MCILQPQEQQKFVIQIGGESDTDDDNEQQQHDLLGGAINDFIKEARHGSVVNNNLLAFFKYLDLFSVTWALLFITLFAFSIIDVKPH